MIAARQIFLGRDGAKLPYDAEVEWIQSSGTQYIDTGIISSYENKVEMSFSVPSFSGEQRIFGQSVQDVYRMGYDSSGIFMSSGGEKKYSTAVAAGSSFYVVLDGTSFTVNGSLVGGLPQTSARGEYNCYAFAWNRSPMLFGAMRMKSLKITRKSDGVLLRDFIPVRFTNELGQSEGAMYDRVSGQLFRNQGTGAFLYGGDVYSVPVETRQYVQNGLVAMWDGKENAGVGKRCDTAQSWVDLSGNGHNATRNGTADFGTNCATLDGTTYFVTQNEMDLSAGFTIEVCARQTSSNNDRDYVSWNIGSGEKLGVDVYNARGASLLRCKFGKGDSVGFFGWSYSSTPGILDEACTIVYTDTALSDMAFWLNASKKQWYNYNVALTSPSDKRIVIGANLSNANKIPGSIMYGEIYSIRIYNKILTDAEIDANYAVDKQRFNLP